MEKSSAKLTIIVAIIGLIGTLGGGFLANYDKFFPKNDKELVPNREESSQSSKDVKPICVPEQRVPAEGAVLPQTPITGGKYKVNWTFGWRDCPEAEKYHLYVLAPGALNPVVDVPTITSATYHSDENITA